MENMGLFVGLFLFFPTTETLHTTGKEPSRKARMAMRDHDPAALFLEFFDISTVICKRSVLIAKATIKLTQRTVSVRSTEIGIFLERHAAALTNLLFHNASSLVVYRPESRSPVAGSSAAFRS